MLEPRGAVHSTIFRREASTITEPLNEPLLLFDEHEEPEFPIHPALEYETRAPKEEDEQQQPPLREKRTKFLLPLQQQQQYTITESATSSRRRKQFLINVKLFTSFVFLILSGVGTVTFTKLQTIPMYNYPNFLNLYGILLYIPLCFAYIGPMSRWNHNNNGNNHRIQQSTSIWPRKRLLKRFVVMGALDSLASTMQTFAAVYVPGPFLILIPQAAIPVSLILARRQPISLAQWMGAGTVLLGVLVVLMPILNANTRHNPEYTCEAINMDYDCTICQLAHTEQECLEAKTTRPFSNETLPFWEVLEHHNNNPEESFNACRWLPFEESSKEKEILEVVWSLILALSTIPMAVSAMYKQRVMISLSRPSQGNLLSNAESTPGTTSPNPPPPAIYVSGWIAVFQFLFAMIIAFPVGLLTSPSLRPWDIPENLVHGMLCYSGHGVLEMGCHPDTFCASHAALWVNLTVVCHVVYTVSMMLVLKYSGTSSVMLFLALTLIVPIGHLVFTLPIMPDQSKSIMRKTDLAGLLVILAGLILYRFSEDPEPLDIDNDEDASAGLPGSEDSEDDSFVSLLYSMFPGEKVQISYTLLREPIMSGDV